MSLNYVPRNQPFGKALYTRERHTSPTRLVEAGAGLGLTTWGVSRSGMVGRALSRGINQAQAAGQADAVRALQQASAMQGALRRGTAVPERTLRQVRAIDRSVEAVPSRFRPAVATAVGILLMHHSHPIRQYTYRPVSMNVRGI